MLRRVSREALSSCKVAPTDVDDLELLVGELATNATRHARAPHYRVDLELYEGLAVITVTDTGKGFARESLPLPGTKRLNDVLPMDGAEMARYGGWGLPLVETLADSVEYLPANPRGTVVRARKCVECVVISPMES
jgi:anti-sigma regulatory factor (Ser/Thr protein kinase)